MGSFTISSERNALTCDPERIIQVKITEFCSTSDCDDFVWSRSCSKWWDTELSAIENCSKTSHWSDDEKSKLQGPERCCGTRISYQESTREKKPRKRKWESVFSGRHKDNVPKETLVVSVMTNKPLGPVAETKVRDEKDDRLLPHLIQRQNRLTEKMSTKRKILTREVRFCVDTKNCDNPECKFWHPPVCLNYKSEKGCVYAGKCRFRHVEVEGKPNKKSKKGGAKGWVDIIKEFTQLGCASQDSYPRKSFLRSRGKVRTKDAVKFSNGTWHQIKIRERKGNREVLSKSVRLTSVFFARQNSRIDHMRRPCTKKDAPAKQRAIWRKIFTISRMRRKLRFIFLVKLKVMPAPASKRPEEREFAVDSGASMHMMSKKKKNGAQKKWTQLKGPEIQQ